MNINKINMFEIIAETAFTHEGNFDYLKEQIRLSSESQVDYIKFQILLKPDEYFIKTHPNYKNISPYLLNEENWIKAFEFSKSIGLKILALPLNLASLKFCEKHTNLIDLYEIHSTCINEVPLLNEFKNTRQKIILGIGGRTSKEIIFAKKIINKADDKIILMFGFQSFPTDKIQLNLNKIYGFKNHFTNAIGYADHNSYKNNDFHFLNNVALTLGVRLFEKHIIIEKGDKRIDYESAITKKDFIDMRKNLNQTLLILGNGNIENLNDKEIIYKNREKQIVALHDIKKDDFFTNKNIGFRITNDKSDLEQKNFVDILKFKAKINIKVDQVINSEHIIKN